MKMMKKYKKKGHKWVGLQILRGGVTFFVRGVTKIAPSVNPFFEKKY